MNSTLLKKVRETFGENSEVEKVYYFLTEQNYPNNDLQFVSSATLGLMEYKLDQSTTCACLLLKAYVDKLFDDNKILEITNEETLKLLQAVATIEKIDTENREVEAENIRKMMFALAKDLRVIIVKLNYILQTLKSNDKSNITYYNKLISETNDIYAPLAGRLGLSKIKVELEDLVLKHNHPDIYKQFLANVDLKAKEREEQIALTIKRLTDMLEELGIKGQIMGRKKHFASIYKKLKNHTMSEIYDLVAVRILVDNIDECYTILGKIHTIYKPMTNRFKDYIALPKPNGYQSLHTTVVADNGKPLEIQIRTHDMHKVAEFGIAAHWMYKEKRIKSTTLDEKLGWVRQLMEKSKEIKAEEFVESLKVDLYSGEIFVQTPKGKVLEFPEGATIIDFAYAIHSDIGNNCIGGKVNGKMVPIYSELSNGDVVEIITSPQPKGPSRDWLKHTKTSSAKDKINTYFRKEMKDENIKKGKSMLEQTIKNKGEIVSRLINSDAILNVCKKYNFFNEDDLFASIGYGGITSLQVFNKLLYEYKSNNPTTEIKDIIKPVINTSKKNRDNAILVRGEKGLMSRFAGCCNPIPGDEIVGFVSHGRGITIHRADCNQLKYIPSERLIDAIWSDDVSALFNASLRIVSNDKTKFLTKLTPLLAEMKINLQKLDITVVGDKVNVHILVTISKKEDLGVFIKELKRIPSVEDVFRV